jgi:Arc/MetJ-type ribon-helix-helix transcriptional regulator
MADQIVSVRMPSSLIGELKELADKNHYLDVSEEIRSLLRDKWQEHKDPYSIKLLAIRESMAKSAVPDKIKQLKQDLKKLLEEINEL